MKDPKLKLLFVNETLELAGGEKSLIALLSNLDSSKYEIDLQLFTYGGALETLIPDYVNVLPVLPFVEFSSQSWSQNIKDFFALKKRNYFVKKVYYSLSLRLKNRNIPEKAQLYWSLTKKAFQKQNKRYDVAIAYAQGVPTFYVEDKINAKSKIAWVNTNLKLPQKCKQYFHSYYSKYDVIVPVSKTTKEHLNELYPDLTLKHTIIPDIVDYHSILKMAALYIPAMNDDVYKILTVSRLNSKMKGMDIAIKACRILRDKGLSFHWYILGTGPYKEDMLAYIDQHHLQDYMTLLGTTLNPYPYFKNADLYVQTSRSEGYGITIAEARLLNTPVVTTRFDTVFIQMKHEKNGLVVDVDANAVANGIERIMKDEQLYRSIEEYLKQEPKQDLTSVALFDAMVENLNCN